MFKEIDKALIDKYGVSCPYYTSYPTLSEWSNDITPHAYATGLKGFGDKGIEPPILLYIHFPFCAKQCYYCICNSIVTHDRTKIRQFLNYLFHEIELLKAFLERHSYAPNIRKLHIGGGSPSFMEIEEFELLIERLKTMVDISNLEEFTVEIDTHTTTRDKLRYYHEKGVNRISLGIQDFDPNVQKAVNRVQSPELVERLLSPEIRSFFRGINFDLLYGLPLQSRESFKRTIEIVKRLSPDRITLLRYAHLPERRRHQRLIKENDLPDKYNKTMIFVDTAYNLIDGGYEHIGIDHFVKPTDDLAKGVQDRTLWRNFNGFSNGGTHRILGLGPTSTCSFMDYYAQNVYSLRDYYMHVDNKELPILRGHKLNNDDLIRRDAINEILCYQSLDFSIIESKYGIDFRDYFRDEIESLTDLIQDGIINLSDQMVTVTPLGRIFINHVCKVFDRYLKGDKAYKVTGP